MSPLEHSPSQLNLHHLSTNSKKANKETSYMAMELELDDDVFFADISKQINLLITDEDDEQNPISLSSSVSFQGLFRESYQTSATPYMMYHEQNYNLVRESKGTGVFIPRCSQPRRKHNHHHKKQGRFSNSFNPKQQLSHHHVHDNNSTTFNNNYNNQESNVFHHASTNQRRTYRDAASLVT